MTIGYVFSRKNDEVFEIFNNQTLTESQKKVKEEKIYCLLKKYLFYKNLPF